MEELLRCGTDIDRNWGSSLTGHFDQERPEAPHVVVGEALQDQARFLFLQDRYEFFPRSVRSWAQKTSRDRLARTAVDDGPRAAARRARSHGGEHTLDL